jgi:ribosomal protein L44E
MKQHRIRLDDDDIALIVSALRSRAGMAGAERLDRCARLVERLTEGSRGNPKFRTPRCIHDVPLELPCARCRKRNSSLVSSQQQRIAESAPPANP